MPIWDSGLGRSEPYNVLPQASGSGQVRYLYEIRAKFLRDPSPIATTEIIPGSTVEDAVRQGENIGGLALPPLVMREPDDGFWDQPGNQ